jgi:adenine-specific DNA methylase
MRTIKRLFFLAVFGAAVYVGYKFAMPYYNHYRFQQDAQYVVKFNVRDEDDMRRKLFEKAREDGLSIPEEDFIVERTKLGYNMKVSWSNTVDIFGKYQKDLDFTVVILE